MLRTQLWKKLFILDHGFLRFLTFVCYISRHLYPLRSINLEELLAAQFYELFHNIDFKSFITSKCLCDSVFRDLEFTPHCLISHFSQTAVSKSSVIYIQYSIPDMFVIDVVQYPWHVCDRCTVVQYPWHVCDRCTLVQ